MRANKNAFIFTFIILMITASSMLEAQHHIYGVHIDALMPVWEAASDRSISELLYFTRDENPHIADAAWRSLANSADSATPELFNAVLESQSELRFLPLSTLPLTAAQLRRLEQLLDQNHDLHPIIAVLGQQGDEQSHNLLLNLAANITANYSPIYHETLALAVSQSSSRFALPADQQRNLATLAIESEHAQIQAAWLYGWYRNVALSLSPETVQYLSEQLPDLWIEMYGLSRQYLIAALGRNRVDWLSSLLSDEYLNDIHPLEAVEIARILPAIRNQSEQQRIAQTLLNHANSVVRIQLYNALARIEGMNQTLFEPNLRRMYSLPVQEQLTLAGLWLIHNQQEACGHIISEAISTLVYEHPAVADQYLSLLPGCFSDQDILPYILTFFNAAPGSPILYRHILTFLTNSPDGFLQNDAIPLLERIASNESVRLNSAWSVFAERHPTLVTASPTLASRVQHASDAGTNRSEILLKPDAAVLKSLGPSPVWIIITTRGELHLRLDPLRSPATVTAIAHLTSQKLHEGSPFHRIVPNFVIQAGELWEGDNSGSPYFRVPTEASEKSFHRGALGIASAGRDTEGSQFFVMHMWAPHLDGRYTNVGYLIEGYDVLDGLMQGDVVLQTRLISSTP